MSDYKEVINSWLKNKKIKKSSVLLTYFFRNGFIFTKHPNKTYFGTTNSSISFIMGGIYLLAYVHSGSDKGIWMLQDRMHNKLDSPTIIQREVKSTKNSEIKLYWLHVKNIEDLQFININDLIWDSYRNASEILRTTKYWNFVREDFIRNKETLTCFWKYTVTDLPSKESIDGFFQKQIDEIRTYSDHEIKQRSAKFHSKPEKIEVITNAYVRNPYVVNEVLKRADGICERCKNKAPFNRKSDGTPYLEVHHLVPLSEDGDDTVTNAIALCPNCHREIHFGS